MYAIEDIGIDIFLFFKQKAACEISECDWSSDVCSSVLLSSKEVTRSFMDCFYEIRLRYKIGRASCRDRVSPPV